MDEESAYERSIEADRDFLHETRLLRNGLDQVWTPDERGQWIANLRTAIGDLDRRADEVMRRHAKFETDYLNVYLPNDAIRRDQERRRAVDMADYMRLRKSQLESDLRRGLDQFEQLVNQDRRERLDAQIGRLHALRPTRYEVDDYRVLDGETNLIRERERLEAKANGSG